MQLYIYIDCLMILFLCVRKIPRVLQSELVEMCKEVTMANYMQDTTMDLLLALVVVICL